MSFSTLFAFTCASTIVFGNPLVDRLNVNVNDSDSVSSEFETEKRRRLVVPGTMEHMLVDPLIYDWPLCTRIDLVEKRCTRPDSNGWCPFNSYEWCHQIRGAVYRANGKCYRALTTCMGCMNPQYRDVRTDALAPVDCAKYKWFGSHDKNFFGQYGHHIEYFRQFVYKICVRSSTTIDGIKFFFKTPKDESYSDFIFTESPWYGATEGPERCFGPVDSIDHVQVGSTPWFWIPLLSLSFRTGETFASFGGGGTHTYAVKSLESVSGGVLRSVEVWHQPGGWINTLKFNWMGGPLDDVIIEGLCNDEFSCRLNFS